MNKLDSQSLARSFSIPTAALDPGPAPCLIVLAPDPEADIANAAPRLWELANALGCGIQLIGLCREEAQESSLRRQIITLSAMLAPVPVESHIEFGRDWLDAVRKNWREGDVVVCFAGQPAGLGRRSLGELLESNLKSTVYVLDGVYPVESPRPQWMSSLLGWGGSLGLITGFLWLQVGLAHLPKDWAHTGLMYLSVLIEVGAVWGWNSLFS